MRTFSLLFVILVVLVSCTENDVTKPAEDEETDFTVSAQMDGPYIFYEDTGLKSYFKDVKGKLRSEAVSFGDVLKVIAPYRDPQEFEFTLEEQLPETIVESNDGNKIFAVSDIEGNYYALTKLLMGNGVVDAGLNWTYGSNHLVFNGDMVDRGRFVTQVLWMMYKLDYQAQKAGGKVHFILGNHDVMCMAGDSRYADDKYLDMADRLGIEYKELYGESAVIGRWMRSKNTVEKINGFIFVHAGISPDVLDLNMALDEINEAMKPYYGKRIDDSVPEKAYKLFKTSGVLWYRGYVKSKEGSYSKAGIDDVNDVLTKYGAKSIIVGHSIVDEISVKYGGKVVTMDVHHPDGKSSSLKFQALLIEGNSLYRVDEKGTKTLLEKY